MSNNKKISGAEAVIRTLIEEGVDLIYGYPGGAIMPIYDELYKFQDKLNHVLTRHEQGATHAAQGFSRVSGKVGVVMATSGPGATNLVTGIADAQIDSTPMVCITGQVASHLLGSDAFQETDIIGISTPVTKWNCQITKAVDIPKIIAKAFYIAKSGRPGPVLIDITKDAQFEMMNFKYEKCKSIRSYKPTPDYSLKDINSANFTVRGFAERNAINSPIQGTAADMIKLAMIKIDAEFKKQNFKSKMLLQVHDELVFDAHKEEVDRIKPIILHCMQTALALPNGVPTDAEIGMGDNWLKAH